MASSKGLQLRRSAVTLTGRWYASDITGDATTACAGHLKSLLSGIEIDMPADN